ncbi:MAG: hypothetical protein JXB32_20675, partial [Deltaproteobacteria bacterium]|nr:hypothetical protein [Deltaproteobacteria bacterium]
MSRQTTRHACCLLLALLVACGARRGADGTPGDDPTASDAGAVSPGGAARAASAPDGTGFAGAPGSSAAEVPAPGAVAPPDRGPWVGPAVEQTPTRDVLCAETGYQPVAPADLDGDGRLDRLAARRDGDRFVLTLHASALISSLPERST